MCLFDDGEVIARVTAFVSRCSWHEELDYKFKNEIIKDIGQEEFDKVGQLYCLDGGHGDKMLYIARNCNIRKKLCSQNETHLRQIYKLDFTSEQKQIFRMLH